MGILDQLLAELQEKNNPISTKYKHNSPTGVPSVPYMHGPAGLFSTPGLERDLISTVLQPVGLGSLIPARGTVVTNPLFAYITGFRDHTGDNKDGVCDDAPIAGAIKNCYQTAQFGRYEYRTRELEINRVGQQVNRGELFDLRLLNSPLMTDMGILNPNVPGNPDLNREVLVRMMEVGVDFQNTLIRQVYTGNPANNSGAGGYKEFPGLDILIGTTKVDAETGATCPSLRSYIHDYNYARADDGNMLSVLSTMLRNLMIIADKTNLSPVNWALVMRAGLFWTLTEIWACNYLTYRCNTLSGAIANVDVSDAIRLRDDMRNGNYLLVDGVRIPVIVDDGIVEDTNTTNASVPSGCFASDIYFVPLTFRGGIASLYWEYLDYSRGAMLGAADGHYAPSDFWTDGGIYLWHKKPPLNWCVQWQAKIEPRLILLTPHLAGRITNVLYCLVQHERDTLKEDPYFVDGGVYNRAGPSLYSDWNTRQ